MPAPQWQTFRLGAKIGAIDTLLSREGTEQVRRLQRALSSVVCVPAGGVPNAAMPPTDDAWFVGRLLLGIVSRGWPTFVSPMVECALLESLDPDALGLTLDDAGQGQIGWRLAPRNRKDLPEWEGAILDALLRGDRRLMPDEVALKDLCDSEAERSFYTGDLTSVFGNAIGWVELQRPFASLNRETLPEGAERRFGSGRVDFSLELPGREDPIRIIVELDGPHHLEPAQRTMDRNRDRLTTSHGWTTVRVPVREISSSVDRLRAVVDEHRLHNPFPFAHLDGTDSHFADRRRAEATRLVLTPHAVARIQFSLSQALADGLLRLDSPTWTVAVVEREVPCAEIAVRDWLATLTHFCHLYGVSLGVRNVHVLVAQDHLAVFPALELPKPLNGQAGESERAAIPEVKLSSLATSRSGERVDLAIDVSVGAHPTRRYPTDPLRDAGIIALRSVRLRTAQRQSGYDVEPWPEPRAISDPLANPASLRFFLQLLFRKADFREGQLPIIERVLRRQDVIGLLPTGAGKSITFQLPALLSPGVALVIDPIKSLMQDQVENLEAAGIDDAIQINSDTRPEERERVEWQFGRGEYRLVFISPERLQIQRFRDLLRTTTARQPVSYLVIDEAHCVSEWGHDFRTAYLNLGRIAAQYCSRDGKRPPLVAVTGTASESVLRDIQRELGIDADDRGAIIRPASFDRPELKFEIVRAPRGGKPGALLNLLTTDLPDALSGTSPETGTGGDAPQVTVEMLADGSCGGIVFCPHRNGQLGVLSVRNKILEELPSFRRGDHAQVPDPPPHDLLRDQASVYCGDLPRQVAIPPSSSWNELKQEIQRSFKRGDLSLLVATKAFGMGIDKPNIRYTVHYAVPQSVEALAQEAGRAGRDRKPAICAVIFSDRLDPEHQTTGQPVPKDCLEIGISTEEAKERQSASGRASDDAEMQMFLHGMSYLGTTLESLAVRGFYHQQIEPKLIKAKSTGATTTTMTLSSAGVFPDDWATVYNHGTPPPVAEGGLDDGEPIGPAEEGRVPSPDLQRVIYRLSLLGIVDDYTVSYAPFSTTYALTLKVQSDAEVVAHLKRYVLRYRNADLFAPVQERLDTSPLDGGVTCKAIDTLVWFVYEQIERRRRAAMHGIRQLMREALRDELAEGDEALREKWRGLTPGERLKLRMNEQLGFGALTEKVFDVVRESPQADDRWWELADRMSNAEEADRVRLQARRAMEDAPEHPGLLILDGLGVMASGIGTVDEAASSLAVGLREALMARERDEADRVARRTVDEVYAKAPHRADQTVREVLRRVRRDPAAAERGVPRAVAAAAYRRTSDEETRRACAAILLEQVNQRVTRLLGGSDGDEPERSAGVGRAGATTP